MGFKRFDLERRTDARVFQGVEMDLRDGAVGGFDSQDRADVFAFIAKDRTDLNKTDFGNAQGDGNQNYDGPKAGQVNQWLNDLATKLISGLAGE